MSDGPIECSVYSVPKALVDATKVQDLTALCENSGDLGSPAVPRMDRPAGLDSQLHRVQTRQWAYLNESGQYKNGVVVLCKDANPQRFVGA